jgi:hypothetical protein
MSTTDEVVRLILELSGAITALVYVVNAARRSSRVKLWGIIGVSLLLFSSVGRFLGHYLVLNNIGPDKLLETQDDINLMYRMILYPSTLAFGLGLVSLGIAVTIDRTTAGSMPNGSGSAPVPGGYQGYQPQVMPGSIPPAAPQGVQQPQQQWGTQPQQPQQQWGAQPQQQWGSQPQQPQQQWGAQPQQPQQQWGANGPQTPQS